MNFRFYMMFVFVLATSTQMNAQEVRTLATVDANGGISVDADGNIFVAHFGPLPPNSSIGKNLYKVTPDGDVTLFLDGRLSVGTGNTVDNNGFIYQCNFNTGQIFKIDPDGIVVDNNYVRVRNPVGIVNNATNNLFICDCSDNAIVRVFPNGSTQTLVQSNLFSCANGITLADDGNLYVSSFSSPNIVRVSPQGVAQTLGSVPGGLGNGHIAYRAADEMLYIASYGGNRIYKMDLSGNAELFAGTGIEGTKNSSDPLDARFDNPNGVAFSPDGCSLYITQDNNVLREIVFDDAPCTISSNPAIPLDEISIHPNPAEDRIEVRGFENINLKDYSIVTPEGKKVLYQGNPRLQYIDVSELPAGAYFLIARDREGHQYAKKLIIN